MAAAQLSSIGLSRASQNSPLLRIGLADVHGREGGHQIGVLRFHQQVSGALAQIGGVLNGVNSSPDAVADCTVGVAVGGDRKTVSPGGVHSGLDLFI